MVFSVISKAAEVEYLKLVEDYKKLVDEAFIKGDLSKTPLWTPYFDSKKTEEMGSTTGQSMARRLGTTEPKNYIYDKKFELAKKLVEAENLNIKGSTIAQPIYSRISKDVNNILYGRTKFIADYVKNNLDTPQIKAKKAFEIVLNSPDALWTKGIYGQVGDLTGNPNRGLIGKVAKTIPEYQKNKKIFEYMAGDGFMRTLKGSVPLTFKDALETAINTKDTKITGGSSWGQLKGYTAPNNAMKFAKQAFRQNKGGVSPEGTQVKFYTPKGKLIKFNVGGTTHLPSSSFFEYLDPKRPEFNKIYGLNPVDKKSKLNKLGKPVVSLRKSINELSEFNEVKNITQKINNSRGLEVPDPQTGKNVKLYDLFRKNLTGAEGRISIPSNAKTPKFYKLRADHAPFAIEHGTFAKNAPFNNLSIISPEVNTALYHLDQNKKFSPEAKNFIKETIYSAKKNKDYDSQIKIIAEQVVDRADEIKNFKGGTYAIPSQLARTANILPEGIKGFTDIDYEEVRRLRQPIEQFVSSVKESGGCRFLVTKALGGTIDKCGEIIRKDPEGAAKKILNISEDTGPINKVKNSAMKVLQSPMLRSAGKFGAIAAGGAVAAGFVKKFMNDDPTTYLSNEEQQKNLLMDMVTGSLDDTPEESPAIGDAYLPALGAATVAGTAAVAPSTIDAVRGGALGAKKSGITKTALKTLGRGLAATATPLGLLATEPLYLADQVQQGDSLGEIATNPFNYLGAAFASDADRIVSRGLNPSIAKTMRLGISPSTLKTVSRRFGLPGLALSAGISGYEMYQNKKAGRGLFDDG